MLQTSLELINLLWMYPSQMFYYAIIGNGLHDKFEVLIDKEQLEKKIIPNI